MDTALSEYKAYKEDQNIKIVLSLNKDNLFGESIHTNSHFRSIHTLEDALLKMIVIEYCGLNEKCLA